MMLWLRMALSHAPKWPPAGTPSWVPGARSVQPGITFQRRTEVGWVPGSVPSSCVTRAPWPPPQTGTERPLPAGLSGGRHELSRFERIPARPPAAPSARAQKPGQKHLGPEKRRALDGPGGASGLGLDPEVTGDRSVGSDLQSKRGSMFANEQATVNINFENHEEIKDITLN